MIILVRIAPAHGWAILHREPAHLAARLTCDHAAAGVIGAPRSLHLLRRRRRRTGEQRPVTRPNVALLKKASRTLTGGLKNGISMFISLIERFASSKARADSKT